MTSGLRLIALSAPLALFATTADAIGPVGNTYVPLAQACRLLDTRAGIGPLSQAGSPYRYGTSNSDIAAATQGGNASGCDIPSGIVAINISVNMIAPTASGDIRAWSDDVGTAGPNAGTAVYNAATRFNGGAATLSVGADGGFYIAVDNGQTDLTVNVAGYWTPLIRSAANFYHDVPFTVTTANTYQTVDFLQGWLAGNTEISPGGSTNFSTVAGMYRIQYRCDAILTAPQAGVIVNGRVLANYAEAVNMTSTTQVNGTMSPVFSEGITPLPAQGAVQIQMRSNVTGVQFANCRMNMAYVGPPPS